jgi:hypothetical protein
MLLCMVKNPKKLNGLIVARVAVSKNVDKIATVPSSATDSRTAATKYFTVRLRLEVPVSGTA